MGARPHDLIVEPAPANVGWRLPLVAVLTAVGAGLGGMALAMLLHAIQHLAYHYSLAEVIGKESFLSGVAGASPLRRLAALITAGIVAGGGWFLLYRYGRPLVGIRRAVGEADADALPPRMPLVSTVCHALLQIVTVALGSPLGREVAPREIGALIGQRMAAAFALPAPLRRQIVAAGAGAGLAAVYNVPFAGALFTLEVLLQSFHPVTAALALCMSALAALVASLGLGAEVQYALPAFKVSPALLAWAVLSGPVAGVAAHFFARFTSAARAHAARGWRLAAFCLLNFTLIGALAMVFPELPGNGKGPALLGFTGHIALGLAATLLALKFTVLCTTLRSGAMGGLLTPGLACGALLGIIGAALWNSLLPEVPAGACAVVLAAAFLATSMQMPLTAIVLVGEFTHLQYDMLPALALAVAGSVCAQRLCAAQARKADAARAPVPAPPGRETGVSLP
ncbi:chloride channel protein [Cupriavidus agavae]|uniref:H+/Cl-antiporter ClcA n=1 Tax=Cupriavidus agavae TaxID=1001822 RepID=A0A4Q7S1G5_9BURK|nr:chloride channel protein [Cupriavidus agavae]RZT39417.1 H+/Cl- antiporter ClcA [Cupriavidus agavae]